MAKKTAAPVWRKSPPDLVARFEAAIPDDPRIERRQMFGYPCIFAGGHMLAGLHQESLVIRMSEADRTEAFDRHGATPFEPMAGRIMREYVVVPEAVLARPRELAAWVRRGLAFVASLPAKQKRKPRKVGVREPANRRK
jgi:TfoX/Sxy family transcriptional regulator of competence genes